MANDAEEEDRYVIRKGIATEITLEERGEHLVLKKGRFSWLHEASLSHSMR